MDSLRWDFMALKAAHSQLVRTSGMAHLTATQQTFPSFSQKRAPFSTLLFGTSPEPNAVTCIVPKLLVLGHTSLPCWPLPISTREKSYPGVIFRLKSTVHLLKQYFRAIFRFLQIHRGISSCCLGKRPRGCSCRCWDLSQTSCTWNPSE